MKRIACLVAAAALFAAAGCTSTPASRIEANQALFASWPPAVQAQVRDGLVSTGFTPQQVLMALGEPNVKTAASSPQGITEVWAYNRSAPRLSVGIGGGSATRSSAVGGAVSANGIKLGQDVAGHVIFTNGIVTNVMVMSR